MIKLQQWLITFCIAVDTEVAPTWFKQLQRKNRERVSERISCSNERARLIWSRIRGRAISLTAQPQTWCQLVSFLKPLETSRKKQNRRKQREGNRTEGRMQEEASRHSGDFVSYPLFPLPLTSDQQSFETIFILFYFIFFVFQSFVCIFFVVFSSLFNFFIS